MGHPCTKRLGERELLVLIIACGSELCFLHSWRSLNLLVLTRARYSNCLMLNENDPTQGIKSGLNLDLSSALCRVLEGKIDSKGGQSKAGYRAGMARSRYRRSMEEAQGHISSWWLASSHVDRSALFLAPPSSFIPLIPRIHSQPFCLPALRQMVPCYCFR